MSESVYFLTIILPLLTILLVFGMKYFASVQQAKSRLAGDEQYRELASRASATQSEISATLTALNLSLANLKDRVTAIEKLLKEVS